MVNGPSLNTNLQAQAVIAVEGAAADAGLEHDIKRSDSEREVKNISWMERLLESGGTKDLTAQILKDFVTKVAQAGIASGGASAPAKVDGKRPEAKKDNLQSEESTDKVDIRANKEVDQTIPINGVGRQEARFGQPERENLAQWEELKEKLVKEGKSAEEIARMELQFKASETKKHLLNLLRDSAIMYYLDSDNSVCRMMRKRGFSALLEKAGKEAGKEAAADAKSELKGFVLQELENELVLRTLLQDGDFTKGYKLVRIGEKVGVDSLAWMEHVWPDKKLHYGLNLLDVPHETTGYLDIKDNDPDAQRRRKERERYEYQDEDEKDLVLKRLRAHYMQLALRPKSAMPLLTWFKVRKLKNGLMRLGIFTKGLDEKIKSEAKILAKLKTMEMLDEALHERASLFDPAKDKLTDNKIKNCLKNLERLGFSLGDQDFEDLRNKANRHMYDLVKRELASVEKETGAASQKKAQQLEKLLSRLQVESNLGLREEV